MVEGTDNLAEVFEDGNLCFTLRKFICVSVILAQHAKNQNTPTITENLMRTFSLSTTMQLTFIISYILLKRLQLLQIDLLAKTIIKKFANALILIQRAKCSLKSFVSWEDHLTIQSNSWLFQVCFEMWCFITPSTSSVFWTDYRFF